MTAIPLICESRVVVCQFPRHDSVWFLSVVESHRAARSSSSRLLSTGALRSSPKWSASSLCHCSDGRAAQATSSESVMQIRVSQLINMIKDSQSLIVVIL
jgi:hypothetical protein